MDCILFQRKNNHLTVLQYNQTHVSTAEIRGGGKAKQKKAKNSKQSQAPKSLPLTPYHYEIDAEFNLVRGIVRYFVCMKLQNKSPKEPELLFGSKETRFFTRFDAFYKATAPLLYHPKHFYEQDFSKIKVFDVLDAAMESFQNCKTAVEKITHDYTSHFPKVKLDELKTLAKVAIANSLNLTLAKKMQTYQDEAKKLSFSFNISIAHPVMTLN